MMKLKLGNSYIEHILFTFTFYIFLYISLGLTFSIIEVQAWKAEWKQVRKFHSFLVPPKPTSIFMFASLKMVSFMLFWMCSQNTDSPDRDEMSLSLAGGNLRMGLDQIEHKLHYAPCNQIRVLCISFLTQLGSKSSMWNINGTVVVFIMRENF